MSSTINVLIVVDTDTINTWSNVLPPGTESNPLYLREAMQNLVSNLVDTGAHTKNQNDDIKGEIKKQLVPFYPIQLVADPEYAEYDNGSGRLYIIAKSGDKIRWRVISLDESSYKAELVNITIESDHSISPDPGGVCTWTVGHAGRASYYYVFTIKDMSMDQDSSTEPMGYYRGDPMIDIKDSNETMLTIGGPKFVLFRP